MKFHTLRRPLSVRVPLAPRLAFRLATSTILALFLTRGLPAEPITITAISPAIAVGGIGWAVGSFIRGTRADALSTADGKTVHDGPYGGWFSSDAHANAPVLGPLGSKLTTDADTAYLGIGKSRVTFPVAVLGTKPGAAIYGYGYAAGGLSQDEKSINGAFSSPGSPANALEVNVQYSLSSLDLFALGPSGDNSVNFDVQIYATTDPDPSAGDPLAPATSFFHEVLFGSSVDLTSGGGSVSANGSLSSSLFSPVTMTAGGAASSLLAPQNFSTSFQLNVPDGVSQFRIVAYSEMTDTLQAANTPEPNTYLLIGCSLICICLFYRRLRRDNPV